MDTVRPAHCPGCGLPYSRTPVHLIDTLPGSELVPYCDTCHRQLTLGAKKSHITTLINKEREGGERIDYDTVWQIALDFADWEHYQIWGKWLKGV